MRSNILCLKTGRLHESPGLVIIHFLGCPIILSRLNFLEKPYYCAWGIARPEGAADGQKSRHQDNVSRSTLEAECVVASQAGQEALSCSAKQEGAVWLALPTISSGGV